MINMVINEFFEKKIALLKECVSLSEEILSTINDIDQVNRLLSARYLKIISLQNLEEEGTRIAEGFLTERQKTKINQLVALLIGLDSDIEKKIKVAQSELKNEMKVNTKHHQLMGYTGKYASVSGRHIDYKK